MPHRYCGELVVDGNMLQSLKAYHFAVLEGAYFEGKLFASICSSDHQGICKQDDFFSQITASASFLPDPTLNRTEEYITNTSWYLFVPVLSKKFNPFMGMLGENESFNAVENSMEAESYEDCEEPSSNIGCSDKKTEDFIDWNFLDFTVTRVRNLKEPGIDSTASVRYGDVMMASHNSCMYMVIGDPKDMHLLKDFYQHPPTDMAGPIDSHEVSTLAHYVHTPLSPGNPGFGGN